jgi:hypothetical protein
VIPHRAGCPRAPTSSGAWLTTEIYEPHRVVARKTDMTWLQGERGSVMGIAHLQVFISEVGDACGTLVEERDPQRPTTITVFDCSGILKWPCGRFRVPGGDWERVPDYGYLNLPSRCGHLELEVPPGCYWVLAGAVSAPTEGAIGLNYTTHVGIVQVNCDATFCVKLFNPTLRMCWMWFREGLQRQADEGRVDPQVISRINEVVEGEVLQAFEASPTDLVLERLFEQQRG